MGAVWITEKNFIPILIDLSYTDMKGFIDSHYIACKTSKDDSYKLLTELSSYSEKFKQEDVKSVFDEFILFANQTALKSIDILTKENDEISSIEKMIINGRLTDGEILLLDYIIKNSSTLIDISSKYDNKSDDYIYSDEHIKLMQYEKEYNFKYSKASYLLQQSGYGKTFNTYEDNFEGFELNIDIFRDLLSMTQYTKSIIESIKVKCAVVNETINKSDKTNAIEKYIKNNNLLEIDALLIKYMVDTKNYNLGDRWMSDRQIEKIKQWEKDNNYDNKLSANYQVALKNAINKDFLDVFSYTSYGNPREYRLKQKYINNINELSQEAQNILKNVMNDYTM